jgi:hypothetical protein
MHQQYSRYQHHYLPNDQGQGTFLNPTSPYPYVPIHPLHYFSSPEQLASSYSVDSVAQATQTPNHFSRAFPSASRLTPLSNQPYLESHTFRQASPPPIISLNSAVFDTMSSVVSMNPPLTSERLQVRQPQFMHSVWKALISVQRLSMCAGLIALVCDAAVSIQRKKTGPFDASDPSRPLPKLLVYINALYHCVTSSSSKKSSPHRRFNVTRKGGMTINAAIVKKKWEIFSLVSFALKYNIGIVSFIGIKSNNNINRNQQEKTRITLSLCVQIVSTRPLDMLPLPKWYLRSASHIREIW